LSDLFLSQIMVATVGQFTRFPDKVFDSSNLVLLASLAFPLHLLSNLPTFNPTKLSSLPSPSLTPFPHIYFPITHHIFFFNLVCQDFYSFIHRPDVPLANFPI
jgi:hypothetical protein